MFLPGSEKNRFPFSNLSLIIPSLTNSVAYRDVVPGDLLIFKNISENVDGESTSLEIPRNRYVELFGPTVGDKVRLADTDLVIEVEKDLLKYGDELVFGGGKSARDGLGQASGVKREDSVDLVITNAIILDPDGYMVSLFEPDFSDNKDKQTSGYVGFTPE